jgi:hypothetical protein
MPNTAFTVCFVVGVVLLVTTVEKWPERVKQHAGKKQRCAVGAEDFASQDWKGKLQFWSGRGP